ncbi:hypothetical protein GPECTOR_46g253 [Gonium pectorale]|uniref:Uncharacterized protein n=1 Tax=Gonium pectorale TaxID=33097 RepID=A0A150G8M4_GONPE|nr:hypothetical protein GPECTOR_46g253 [Gonium pectorale]|eukprot:KXZ46184.1 hypothetical protein GPECTOR_46g253 [Gonium pectorale]
MRGPGSNAGARTAALSEATSLQTFMNSEPPSLGTSTTALPTMPSARHPAAARIQEEEDALPGASQSHSRAQSSRRAGSGSNSGAPAPPPPASDDPWSSLQTQYRIRERADTEDEPERERERERSNLAAVSMRSRTGAGMSRNAGTAPDGGKEVLVLGDDDPFSGTQANMMVSMRSTTRGPNSLAATKPGSQPKQGGWGSGQMAQAGELMIGDDDWLDSDRPPGVSALAAQLPGASWPAQKGGSYAQEPADPHEALLKAPLAKGRPADDVQCEDIEDVDALLDSEMETQGLSNKSLASKLAAYEAQFGKE